MKTAWGAVRYPLSHLSIHLPFWAFGTASINFRGICSLFQPIQAIFKLAFSKLTMAARFYQFWDKYVSIEPGARDYIETVSRVRYYAPGDYFIRAGESRRFWCFILSGVVAYANYGGDMDEKYHWVALSNQYFTGTAHPFTQRPTRHAILFLQSSALLLVPSEHFQYAQQRFPSFAELVHVIKQQRLDQTMSLAEIRLLPATEQYAAFRNQMRDLYRILSEPQQIRLLRMHRATFYRAKDAYEHANR